MQAIVRKPVLVDSPLGARAALRGGFDRIYAAIPEGAGWAQCAFSALTLTSHFQPIFGVGLRRCVAYEGLLNATNVQGQPTSPETVFALSASHQEELYLDWLCRALHLRNFANVGNPGDMVFLNAYPEAAIEDPHHPLVFGDMIRHYGVDPSAVVVEILETGVSDEAKLIDAAQLYRQLGCRVAIDDFGIGYSNFDRLWRLKPDFVKIDRSVTASAVRDAQARLVLANMVKLIHECGAQVIVEGIETREQATLAIDVGTDYVQGYYFARPGLASVPAGLCDGLFASLDDERMAQATARRRAGTQASNITLDVHANALNVAIMDLQSGSSFARATECFRALPNVLRAYLVDATNTTHATGHSQKMILEWIDQTHTDAGSAPDRIAQDTTPLGQLQRLVSESLTVPRQLHVISPTDAPEHARGITLSCAFERNGVMVVLAGDLVDRRSPSPRRVRGAAPVGQAQSARIIQLHL